ncbi:MAG: hypothetical protein IIB14_10405 [Chloroflexi bacterium]|nr:hypothetical protein [Chloroflexota bacterium]
MAAVESAKNAKSDDTTAPQTLAAPAALEVEEPTIESLAAGDQSTEPVTSQTAIEAPVAQTQETAPSTPLPAPLIRALPTAALDESTSRVKEPVAETQMPEVIVAETREFREFRIPLRELEIALGVLVALLLASAYWVARRGRSRP